MHLTLNRSVGPFHLFLAINILLNSSPSSYCTVLWSSGGRCRGGGEGFWVIQVKVPKLTEVCVGYIKPSVRALDWRVRLEAVNHFESCYSSLQWHWWLV